MGQLRRVAACWQPSRDLRGGTELRHPRAHSLADVPSQDLLRYAELSQPQVQAPPGAPPDPAEGSAACLAAQGCPASAGSLPSQAPTCCPT